MLGIPRFVMRNAKGYGNRLSCAFMSSAPSRVFVLGGYQTDFARNWKRESMDLQGVMSDVVEKGLTSASINAEDVDCLHVGNFAGELFCGQGHLGGLASSAHEKFIGKPASRHEGACASGSLALLAASADIESGRYGLAAVIGVEQMRNVPGEEAAKLIGGPAMWAGRECVGKKFPWPHMFSNLADEYNIRYGLHRDHLARIAAINFENAKRNPNAQTRNWKLEKENFAANDVTNPVVDGWMRKHDCSQLTDGSAIVFLASEAVAELWAKRRNIRIQDVPYIAGWGHRTDAMSFAQKVASSKNHDYIFPHVRGCITDAFRRAGMSSVRELQGIEVHDCFTSTEYMAIDHFGITEPGESWRAVESGEIEFNGSIPINPSGGLIGLGHPVGATGVRMFLDAYKQVTGSAGDYQLKNVNKFATLNLGGSATTSVCFIVAKP